MSSRPWTMCSKLPMWNRHHISPAAFRSLGTALVSSEKLHFRKVLFKYDSHKFQKRGYLTTANASSSFQNGENYDHICELASSSLRFGPGSTMEVGYDLASLKARRILLFVDPHVAKLPPFENVLCSIDQHVPKSYELDIYDQIRVEPDNESFQRAISYTTNQTTKHGHYDAIVALGGGSTIDTAKAANLYSCYPPNNFYDYVNPPLGKGLPVPGPLTPLIAIPTTAGTGSETTGVAIFDDTPTKSKTGIAHRRLKATLGIVDPDNIRSLTPSVAKYSGIDVLCHAMESYTAIPYNRRPSGKPPSPILRPAYQGSNPISDVWSIHALKECTEYLPRVVENLHSDEEARSKMCLAASSAGMGFGNAGVHLCHGMSYAVASQVKGDFWVDGYQRMDCGRDNEKDSGGKHGLVPHGLSVVINAPAVFRFTGTPMSVMNDAAMSPAEEYSMDRHVKCATILANARMKRRGSTAANRVISEKAMREKPGEALSNELLELMNDLNIPIGIRSLGYNENDIEELAKGTLPQHRVTKLSPRQPVGLEELKILFTEALDN
mmetsp:Transcript_1572/g.3546  ORF Transcript_1572/g.3546 Transcript_1572/m.3546 type:complete len:551 (+) Transcript_1572:332-1984(+)